MVTLNSPWSFWYHSSKECSWTPDSYTFIDKVYTAEEFWGVFKLLSQKHYESGIIFIMKGDIFPDWSSPENINGGFLSYKVHTRGHERFFHDVIKRWAERLISDTVTNNEMIPNGMSVSPKSGHCIVKVWFKSNIYDTHNIISRDLPMVGTGKFTSFITKKS